MVIELDGPSNFPKIVTSDKIDFNIKSPRTRVFSC